MFIPCVVDRDRGRDVVVIAGVRTSDGRRRHEDGGGCPGDSQP